METIIISSEFYFKAPYCELTSDAKLLYAHLYTQALTGQEWSAAKAVVGDIVPNKNTDKVAAISCLSFVYIFIFTSTLNYS